MTSSEIVGCLWDDWLDTVQQIKRWESGVKEYEATLAAAASKPPRTALSQRLRKRVSKREHQRIRRKR